MLFAVVGVLVVVTVLGSVHLYLWRRLVRDVSVRGGWWRRAGSALVVLLPLCTVATFVSGRANAPFAVERALAWPGYMWLALMIYLLLTLAVVEPLRWLLRRRWAPPAAPSGTASGPETPDAGAEAYSPPDSSAGEISAAAGKGSVGSDAAAAEEGDAAGAPEKDLARRALLSKTIAIGAGAVAAATVGTGAYGVLNGPTLKRVAVPLAKLPRGAHRYRIAVVSDMHLGPILGRAHTRRVVDLINSTQPDMVAIVGDLVDGTVDDLGPAADPLRDLRSRDGSFFVTGNHEYFGDARSWIEHLRTLDVHPLENARRELPYFDLAGVNDVQGEETGQGPDFKKALGDRDASRASVLLAHQPVQIHDAVRHGVDLQLSGHTHGGQLWPGNFLAGLANPTVAGLERYGDTQLYVTRGAGAWGPPVRVGAESDMTVVELHSADA
ncbi:metallophosphoesterase [Streptomyces sp. ODS28]|uniref:metallophosphoesterase n=1 Tax=Streptomyces sp. ODS28 TaxID=3136688 RepID=UPI0031E78C4C